MALDQAIHELNQSIEGDSSQDHWPDLVRLRLSACRQALEEDPEGTAVGRLRDGWLSARGRAADRDRRALVARLRAIAPRVADRPSAEGSVPDVRRLALDLEHYRQRLHDLVYDSVGLELGGSE